MFVPKIKSACKWSPVICPAFILPANIAFADMTLADIIGDFELDGKTPGPST